ncbi:MAG: oligosaccharide flippase family protein [Bacteroidia bacterium]|nr:oligosaccharide flippase family protein [Bacteroidia bacterium]
MSFYSKIKTKLIQNELYKDSFWALLGNFFGKGLSYVAGIFVARILGSEDFGEYGLIRNVVISISVFSTFGLGFTSTKLIADLAINDKEQIRYLINDVIKITSIISGIISIAVYILADPISEFALNSVSLKGPLRIVSLWIFFNSISTTQIAILSGLGVYKILAKWSLIIGVFTFSISLLFTSLWNLNGALLALLITQISSWLIYKGLIKNYIRERAFEKGQHKIQVKSIIKFTLPIALQDITYSIFGVVTNLILVHNSNYKEIGLYNAANQISAIVLFFPVVLRNVFLTHFSKMKLKDSKNDFNILKHVFLINFIVTGLPIFLIVVFNTTITSLFGNSYIGLKNVMIINVITVFFLSSINILSQWFLSNDKNWFIFWVKLIRDVLLILVLCFFLGIDFSGSLSISWSMLIVNSVLFLFMIYKINVKKINKY